MKPISSNLLRVVLLTLAALWAVYLLRWVLLPFVAAAALACVAEPLIRWVCARWGWPRWLAGLAAFALIVAVLGALTFAAIRFGLPDLQEFARDVPGEFHDFLQRLFGGRPMHLGGTTLTADDVSREAQNAAANWIGPASVVRFAMMGAAVGMGVFLALVLLLYFLLQGPRLVRGALWLVPPRQRGRATHFAEQVLPLVWRYFVGVLVVITYASVLTWLVSRWILGVPHAALFAIVVGFLELVPVAGPILSAALIGAVALSRGSVGEVLGFAGFAIGLRLSIDQAVGPLILGRAVSVPAPVIIFAMLCGGAIWGILGVVLAVPVAAMIRLALQIAYDEQPPMPPPR